jgi:hypothetical protein
MENIAKMNISGIWLLAENVRGMKNHIADGTT